MKVEYHRKFLKSYKARILDNPKLDKKFKERLNLFLEDPQNPLLRDHQLTGARRNLRAFSITGDIKVLYHKSEETVTLVDIGTHTQVY